MYQEILKLTNKMYYEIFIGTFV